MIQHVEKSGSRSGTDATDRSSTAELTWCIWGSTSVDTIRDYLLANNVVPGIYDDLIFKSLSWEHNGAGVWEFRANYVHPDASDEEQTLDLGDFTFSFDTGGGTVTRTVSLATTKYAKAGYTAPDFRGAINVIRDKAESKIEGVEVGIPALRFSIRKRMPQSVITLAYLQTLKEMTYRTNSGAFLGFAAGELLFIGASGQEGTDTDPEVTFNFIASDNVSGLTVGDITGISKQGHQYLWVLFEDVEDATAAMTVKQPQAAYVEKVYDSANFANLQIV